MIKSLDVNEVYLMFRREKARSAQLVKDLEETLYHKGSDNKFKVFDIKAKVKEFKNAK